MKRMKVVLLIAFAMVSIVFMVQFKNNHSAKERLREAGIRYYRMGWYDDADECFALALKQKEAFDDASDRDIYYYLADGEMKQKDYSSAIKYYEKLIEIGEDSKDLYGNLGICYHLQGKDDMCYDYLKKAAKAEDSDSSIIYTLMIACQNLGKFDEAKEYASKGYKLAKSTLSPDAKSMLKSSKGGTVTSKLAGELKEYGTFAYLNG
ncbi:MAG: tetratricopeptide repeat protein, partial [Lachnospiraceae bacterium]|nr:tetratricopeptide repeat protein [Lachnospiraceae bacterium]